MPCLHMATNLAHRARVIDHHVIKTPLSEKKVLSNTCSATRKERKKERQFIIPTQQLHGFVTMITKFTLIIVALELPFS